MDERIDDIILNELNISIFQRWIGCKIHNKEGIMNFSKFPENPLNPSLFLLLIEVGRFKR